MPIIAPNVVIREVALIAYPSPVNRKNAQILLEAEGVHFDALDSVPTAVRTKLWQGMVDFAAGKSAEEVTKSIDESWTQP